MESIRQNEPDGAIRCSPRFDVLSSAELEGFDRMTEATIIRAAVLRLYPNQQQAAALRRWQGGLRYVWNAALEDQAGAIPPVPQGETRILKRAARESNRALV